MQKTQRLIDRLDKILGTGNGLLAEEQLDMAALKDILDDCFLIKESKGVFKFSFMGKNIIEAFGNKSFSKDMNEMILPSNHSIAENIMKAIKTKKPVETSDEFINGDGIKIKYRKKIYPLTDEIGGVEVKYIFGGMRWKAEY